MGNLGNALREVRWCEEAITAHQDAAAIRRATGDRHRESTALNNLEADQRCTAELTPRVPTAARFLPAPCRRPVPARSRR
jgi:hypothetical protein